LMEVDLPRVTPVGSISQPTLAENVDVPDGEGFSSPTEEPWILAPDEFSAPPVPPEAFAGQAADEGRPAAVAGFIGRAVGSIHQSIDFWKETFEKDPYVWLILEKGYKIPVKMTTEEKSTRYRERNNKSARDNMDFIRKEVKRLLDGGQVIKVDKPPKVINPLSVANKINADDTEKPRLVIDLLRWVNKFVVPDHFCMSRFQVALALSTQGDYQNVFDISKAYHHIRLNPESYELVGFCVMSEAGVEEYYHYVVVVFGLGPGGQALCRVIRPILIFLNMNRKAAATPRLRGALVIPLWKTAKFWTFAYRDGVHLNGLFAKMQIVRMKTTAWELLRKDIIGGKEIQFLVLRFSGKVGVEPLESKQELNSSETRCN
jgi:hypothetical protein